MGRRSRASYEPTYQLLLESFRARPYDFVFASQRATCTTKTARTGWSVGWPQYGLRPIVELLKEESQPRTSAEQISADEIKISRATQMSAGNILSMADQIVRALTPIYSYAKAKFGNLSAAEMDQIVSNPKMLASLNHLGTTCAKFIHVGGQLGRWSLEIERLRVGDPTSIIKVEHEETIDTGMLEKEARAFLQAVSREQQPQPPSLPAPTNGKGAAQ